MSQTEEALNGQAEQAENRRPYAAPSNVVTVLTRCRTRNLPTKIDDDLFRVAQIPDAVFGRVRFALRFLDFIDAEDRPTQKLAALAAAPEPEYRELLAATLRDAYAGDFAKVNPAEDTQAQIVAAFQPYEPRSQTSRMVMLFLGLCREAGIPVLEAPRERQMKPRASRSTPPKPRARAYGGGSTGGAQPADTGPSGEMLFGVSTEDIGHLTEEEFAKVWDALGVVARARSRPPAPEPKASADEAEGDEEPAGGGE